MCIPPPLLASNCWKFDQTCHHSSIKRRGKFNPLNAESIFEFLMAKKDNVKNSFSFSQVVLFLGNPAEIYSTVKVTDFVPKWNMYDPIIPHMVETFLKYVNMMSSGLAIINVLPAFFFDGQHIAVALCDLLLGSHVTDATMRLAISLCATVFGSLLLLGGVLTPLIVPYL